MSQERIELVLFAASPDDVEWERETGVREVVDELNDSVARQQGYVIRVRTWQDVTPAAGRAQGVVLDQIGGVDIFVGIMAKRFGSPTDHYESGTEEEFYAAYNHWCSTEKPHVLFYFGQPLQRFRSRGELDEMGRVLRFKTEVEGLALTSEYDGRREFTRKLRKHLTNLLLEWSKESARSQRATEGSVVLPYWEVWRDAAVGRRGPGMRTEAGLYASATRSIDFMTISGRSIYSGDVEEILREKSGTDLRVRLLLFDWNSPWVRAKMEDERRRTTAEIELAREKAQSIARQLLKASAEGGIDLQIRLYQEYPVWRFIVIDERKAYVGFYPEGKRGYEGPLFVVEKETAGGLLQPIMQLFETTWESSGVSLALDDRRLDLEPLV